MDGLATSKKADRDAFMKTVGGRVIVWASAAVGLAIFFAVGRWMVIPYLPGYSVSLLIGSPIGNVLTTAIVYLGVVAAASVILGSVRPAIGLWMASFGLAAFSARGGTLSIFLRDGGSFGLLIVETLLLAGLTVAGLLTTRRLSSNHPLAVLTKGAPPTLQQKLFSIGVQVLVTMVLVLLLAKSDDKGQALAAVGFASLLATLAADNTQPVGFTPLAIAPPFVVAIFGYAWALISNHTPNLLTMALPLDYASFGVAGTILGHWITHQWREEADG